MSYIALEVKLSFTDGQKPDEVRKAVEQTIRDNLLPQMGDFAQVETEVSEYSGNWR
jgi:hypothetical protein